MEVPWQFLVGLEHNTEKNRQTDWHICISWLLSEQEIKELVRPGAFYLTAPESTDYTGWTMSGLVYDPANRPL